MLVVPVKKRIVLYGGPKSGKSRALATIPKGAKLWLLDVDGQLGAFAILWNELGHPDKNIKIVPVNTTSSNPSITFAKIRDALWSPPSGYDFYSVDCYSTVGLFITYKVVGKAENRNYNMLNNQQLAGCVTDFWMELAAKVQRYGAWLITVMHEKWHDVEDGSVEKGDWRNKKQILIPEVASGARVVIPGQGDFVWHVERDKEVSQKGGTTISRSVSVVRTRGTPLIMASSTGKDHLLKPLEPLNIGNIIQKMGEDWRAKPPEVPRFGSSKPDPPLRKKTKKKVRKGGYS